MKLVPPPTRLALAILFAAAPAARAQERPRPSPDVPAEKVYKNIRVFQGLPSTEIDGAMDFMSASLNVECAHCHVKSDSGPWPMEKDDKAAKLTAREMIVMTREINKANFQGKRIVTCATCHQGHALPAALPPMAGEKAAAETTPESAQAKKPPLPSLKDVLARYAEALGGRTAFEKITSRVTKGTYSRAGGPEMPVQIDQKAPDRYRWTVERKDGPFTRAYDGRTGWNANAREAEPMDADELPGMRRRAVFFQDIDLKEGYAVLAVSGVERRQGRDLVLVEGRAKDGGREELSFDAATGLLARRIEYRETALGVLPSETDYEDYREVDGVRLPFTVSRVSPWSRQVERYTEIRQNVPIDDSRFAMPVLK